MKKITYLHLIILVSLVFNFWTYTNPNPAGASEPGDIILGWNPNEESDLAGYKLYGQTGDSCPPLDYIDTYPESDLDDPLAPMVQLTGIENNVRYYFAVTAYDTNGNESGYSNIIYYFNGQWGEAICSSKPRYRLYNPNNFHHHYTTDANEYDALASLGWIQEGKSCGLFDGPYVIGSVETVPYYRLYNPNSYEHHWTTDANEYEVLGTIGWNQEGVDGYVFPSQVTGSQPLYRLYNPNDGLHHWTMDSNERTVLIGNGFVDEGIACYVFH